MNNLPYEGKLFLSHELQKKALIDKVIVDTPGRASLRQVKKCLKNGESLSGLDDVRPLVLLMIPMAPVVSEATERIRDTSLVVTQKTHEL